MKWLGIRAVATLSGRPLRRRDLSQNIGAVSSCTMCKQRISLDPTEPKIRLLDPKATSAAIRPPPTPEYPLTPSPTAPLVLQSHDDTNFSR